MGFEKNENKPESPTETMKGVLHEKMLAKNFYLEEGETEEEVLKRCELLEKILDKLDDIAPQVIKTYREIFEENGINEEQTGKLSLVVVGGRVHGESELKTWSDIDLIITAERPFLETRSVFLTREEEADLPETISQSSGVPKAMKDRFVSDILPRISEMIGTDLSDKGAIELKGYGNQRNEDVKNGLVIFTE